MKMKKTTLNHANSKLSPFRGNGKGAFLRDNECRPLWILKTGILLIKRSFPEFLQEVTLKNSILKGFLSVPVHRQAAVRPKACFSG